MIIGVLEIELFISQSRSLKDKRSVVKRILDRVRNKFNVSAAEIDYLDLHQRAVIAVVVVSNDQRFANRALSHVSDFIESLYLAEVIRIDLSFR